MVGSRRLAALASMLLASSARADQCAVLSLVQAAKAIQVLQKGLAYATFCEPCHERAPAPASRIRSVELSDFSEPGLKEISVNGEATDLAYLFVEDHPGSGLYTNAAALAGCPASDVSATLRLGGAAHPQKQALESLVGSWRVTLRTTSSDCPQAVAGDERVERWNVTLRQHQALSVQVDGAPTFPDSYAGELTHEGEIALSASLHGQRPKVSVALRVSDDQHLSGTRIVQNETCAITMDVAATRE
jgi:hypothetical protein